MDRTISTKEYRFNEEKHLHELLVNGEWKALTGCTTVLSVLNKPALIQWAANEAAAFAFAQEPVTGLKEEILKYPKITTEVANAIDKLFPVWKKARLAHRAKKEEAGDWGTSIHAEIEKLVKEAINTSGGILGAKNEVSDSVKHFVKWANDNKVRFLENEKQMYSKELFIGGICDLIVEIDNQLWLVDIKTGGIYYEAFWQMAGYQLMMESMGYPDIVGAIVLNLRKDGTFEEKRSASMEDSKKGFIACLEIYRLSEKLKNNI